MALIKTVQEVMNERVKDSQALAKDKFAPAIRPIYASEDNGRPIHVGSSLLLKINDVPHLLTAAHVIDWIKHSSLYIGGEGHLTEIEAEFRVTKANNRDDDRYDFAFAVVPAPMAAKLGSVTYILDNEISDMPAPATGHVYMALGYPNSKNNKIDHTKQHIASVIWPYTATVLSDPDATALAKSLRVGGEDHVFIKFAKRSRDMRTGKIVSSLKPTGISGGALIDLGNLVKLDRFAEPGTGGRLVGLLIEHRAGYKAMIATRMTTIIRAIRSHRDG
jgi:desulfoferrodoxin (superoxide reductase-like protein)